METTPQGPKETSPGGPSTAVGETRQDRHWKRLRTALVGALVFWICLHSQLGSKGLSETIGFHVGAAAGGVLISLIYILPIAAATALLYSLLALFNSPSRSRIAYLLRLHWGIVVLSALAAWTSAELLVLHDDVSFLMEVARAPDVPQARSRAWISGSSLVYRPGIGAHATD